MVTKILSDIVLSDKVSSYQQVSEAKISSGSSLPQVLLSKKAVQKNKTQEKKIRGGGQNLKEQWP